MKQGYTRLSRCLVLLAGVFVSSTSLAEELYTCSDPVYGVNGSGGYGTTYTSPNCNANNTANAPSTVVTSQAVLQSSAAHITGMVNARVDRLRNSDNTMLASADRPLGSGISSGDIGDWGFGVWANAAYSGIENKFTPTKYSGHVTTAMVGVDTMLGSNNTILGLALGWEDQSFTTDFNQGDQDATGWSVTPYLAFLIDEYWSLSFLGGYSWIDYDLVRKDPALGSRFTGSPDADRWYVSGDANFEYPCDRWRFAANAGLLYMKEKRDSYTDSGPQLVAQPSQETELGRFRLGGRAGYNLNGVVEPYVRAAFLWDFTQTDIVVAATQATPSNADVAGVFGGGFNFFINDIFSVNIDAYTEQFRDDIDRWGVSGMFLAKF